MINGKHMIPVIPVGTLVTLWTGSVMLTVYTVTTVLSSGVHIDVNVETTGIGMVVAFTPCNNPLSL